MVTGLQQTADRHPWPRSTCFYPETVGIEQECAVEWHRALGPGITGWNLWGPELKSSICAKKPAGMLHFFGLTIAHAQQVPGA